ncbi:MAG: hypothetical protein EAX89_05625 [Candidatus Lokiarchaeota archaeon]|nr:hypothetical protein [Candidatus Lokiarchaeota archaeon]
MIVIFIDQIENFLSFLAKRIMDEIFYEIKDVKNQSDLSLDIKKEVILHFLAKAGDTLILYETKQTISKANNEDINKEVIESIQAIFSQVDPSLKLINGKIREIFLSYSH